MTAETADRSRSSSTFTSSRSSGRAAAHNVSERAATVSRALATTPAGPAVRDRGSVSMASLNQEVPTVFELFGL